MIRQGSILNQRYEIIELVGGGGMSLIYRARDMQSHLVVAIKVLRDQFTSDPAFIARFRREGISVASLDHPNIVKIYGVGQDEDIYYLIMEMIEGKDLKQVLQDKETFKSRELYPIVAQICEAISYAHHKRIIHRDIKPHNVIVRPDGQIKVTDFGIARAASEATMTHTGSIMGSVHYLSPEQAKGEIADERSDIYSLGVLLYEMATGKLPHEGESPISVAVQKIQQDPLPPRKANPHLSEALETVILRAMNRDPRQRYQTVAELKDDLREACFNNRVLYQPVPEPDPMQDTLQSTNLSKVELDSIKAAARHNLSKSLDENNNQYASSNINKTNKSFKPWLKWMIFLSVLIIGGLLIGMMLSSIWYEPIEVPVPNLIGEPYQEALEILEDQGLKGQLSEERSYHSSVAKDSIAYQEPSANVPVKEGSIVQLTISAGPLLVEVPDLTGSNQQQAEVLLVNNGLVLEGIEQEFDEFIEKDSVISQDPLANQMVEPNTSVSIVLSKGPEIEMMKMQSFVGMPLDDAIAAAKSLGIAIGTVDNELSWNFTKGMIIRQEPIGESEVPIGTSVDFIISAGPGPGSSSMED